MKIVNFRLISSICFSISHSHKISTFHPNFFKFFTWSLSLLIFRSSLVFHFSCPVLGIVPSLQPLCKCQKHPWTKTTFLYLGRTISGWPGGFLHEAGICTQFYVEYCGLFFRTRVPASYPWHHVTSFSFDQISILLRFRRSFNYKCVIFTAITATPFKNLILDFVPNCLSGSCTCIKYFTPIFFPHFGEECPDGGISCICWSIMDSQKNTPLFYWLC